eukprot:TCONS_00048420-protein
MVVQIAFLGAGIISTSTAFRLLKQRPDFEVTIIAKSFSPNTTSDGAAGFWGPYFSGTPEKIVLKNSKATYDYVMDLIREQSHSAAIGLSTCHGFRVNTRQEREDIFWSDIPQNFHILNKEELKRFPPEIKSGVGYTSVFIEAKKLIPYYMKEIEKMGGKFTQKDVKSIKDIGTNYDVIVNCTGLGSRDLVGDKKVYPLRGQIMKVKAPWCREFVMWQEKEHQAYILPNQDFVVLGGTAHASENPDVLLEHKQWIKSTTTKLMPSLADAEHVGDWVGFRPAREGGERSEIEDYDIGDHKTVKVVHSYGHGGSGLTVFWGCAEDTINLIYHCLPTVKMSKL